MTQKTKKLSLALLTMLGASAAVPAIAQAGIIDHPVPILIDPPPAPDFTAITTQNEFKRLLGIKASDSGAYQDALNQFGRVLPISANAGVDAMVRYWVN